MISNYFSILQCNVKVERQTYCPMPCVKKSNLSAAPSKSGPLDFPSEKSFLLFFAHEKGLGHMFQK